MEAIKRWIFRRKYSLGLCIFFLLWYGFQLLVFHSYNQQTADWLFFMERPPDHISPGLAFAPISHNFEGYQHISANVFLLFVIGGIIEPYLSNEHSYFTEKTILVIVLGIGYFGTYYVNFYLEAWTYGGASGGIFALLIYGGIYLRGVIYNQLMWIMDSNVSMRRTDNLKELIPLIIPLLLLSILFVEITSVQNAGHIVGFIFGFCYFIIEYLLIKLKVNIG